MPYISINNVIFFLSSSIYYFLFYYRLLLLWYNNHLKNFILTVTTIFKDFYKLETKKVMFYSVTSNNVNENKNTENANENDRKMLLIQNIYKILTTCLINFKERCKRIPFWYQSISYLARNSFVTVLSMNLKYLINGEK
jgi:hypothetical protein